MDYDKLFDDALNSVLEDYSNNEIRFYSERDLQEHLFHECRRLVEERGFPFPLKLYADRSVFSKRAKVDMVLGDNEILIELKLEPDYPGVNKPVAFTTKREGESSVEGDLEKIEKYARRGKCAHFVMIDEDGRHVRRIATEKWKAIPIKRGRRKKLSHYLHVKLGGR